MDRFPSELSDLLTPRGRRALASPTLAAAVAREGVVYVENALERDAALAGHALLERRLRPLLVPLARAIPPESISNQTRNHQERLVKVARQATAYLERRGAASSRMAERIGLVRLLRSASLRAAAERLAGRALDPRSGQQLLRYGPGDYVGPHTDHYPEDPRAAGGYVDLHLSFGHPAVRHQFLVWAVDGHFTRMAPVGAPGGIAVYRLPLWHYTTPLVARRGHAVDAARWVALATFRYAARR